MNLLQYKSEEMVSSTELIRKSKNIFNKLQKKQIEKAVILRDGKPQFMLLDFETYEELMTEYLALKQENLNVTPQKKKEKALEKIVTSTFIEEEYLDEEIKEDDLEKALAQIEELDLDNSNKNEEINTPIEIEQKTETEKQPLKEFWE
ncbi:hypothetical protein [Halarcobacter bivalviorum]|uniref:Antitoxin n=1 Tax=Halarcobacter bivalviorum TaxID=663364 RepID=A0AAX2AAH5_9BACT|nr:hypothetical protein [Halarcobacter bivalviorum]AXH11096.1 hypothetical protein ABIV_0054 [Halarcobacter bivalviorum]RXK09716.1 hypothetical protein CRV05_08270 [Halarcobacter bivalviorum]